MNNATKAMNRRIRAWLPDAEKEHARLIVKAETLQGTAKKVTLKHAEELQYQIRLLKLELATPEETTAFDMDSHENVEMGMGR